MSETAIERLERSTARAEEIADQLDAAIAEAQAAREREAESREES